MGRTSASRIQRAKTASTSARVSLPDRSWRFRDAGPPGTVTEDLPRPIVRRSRGEPLPASRIHGAHGIRRRVPPALFAQSVPLTGVTSVHRLNRRLRELTVHGDVELEADHAFAGVAASSAQTCSSAISETERPCASASPLGKKGVVVDSDPSCARPPLPRTVRPVAILPSRRAFVFFRCSPRSAWFQTLTSSFRLAIQRSRSERSRYHARPTRTIGSSPRWTMSRRLVLIDAVFSWRRASRRSTSEARSIDVGDATHGQYA